MENTPASLDEAISRMQLESKARGIARLTEIFGRLFTREELSNALEHSSFNVENAAVYLQDRLPSQVMKPETKEPVFELLESEMFGECSKKITSESNFHSQFMNLSQVPQVKCPETGPLALEFSLSPQYFDCFIPVVYVSDEILKEIFAFFTAPQRGRLAAVCKTFKMIEESAVYLYKRDCMMLWGSQNRPEISPFLHPFNDLDVLWGKNFQAFRDSKEFCKSFKNWRNMWIKRPKIRFNGVYISRVSFFKQGQVNMDNLPSFHKVVFYRYLRFYSDFSVVCVNSTKKPREIFRQIEKSYPESRLGEWVRKDCSLQIHLSAKSEVFTYDLDLKSSFPFQFDLLKLEKVRSRNASDLSFFEHNINNEAWPRYFRYYPLHN
jgi:hypothetical protein